jgi:hypothetical protein
MWHYPRGPWACWRAEGGLCAAQNGAAVSAHGWSAECRVALRISAMLYAGDEGLEVRVRGVGASVSFLRWGTTQGARSGE